MNKVILIGRLCADPDVRYSQGENSMAVARYRLAVDRRYKREDEQKANALQEEIYKIQDKYNSIEDEQERETLKSMERSKVYQKQYQDALKAQVNSILDKMHRKEFKTVNKYLNDCYDKAFTGNMYVLHGEGIPLIVPIDQEKVVRAVQVNSKISKGLYSRLGEDVDLLKRKITAQISRGVATGMSYSQMAQQLAGYTKIGYNNAVRITRTEGHRIQQESTMDACYAARERGADVVKQWDATMDANTRESHQMVDGEIRALDEKFSNGLMYPGDPSGNAAEVINCRCILLQRAKWALDQKELDRLKERASFYGLDKTKSFDEFNKKYIGTVENSKGNKIKMDLQFFAKIPDEKLTEYALNFEHPTGKEKAKAFKEALGYTKESYTDLKTKILDSFDEKELVYKREDKYGKRYEQIMQITGPNGKTANVLTAWIKDNDNAEPRLTSIYVDKR